MLQPLALLATAATLWSSSFTHAPGAQKLVISEPSTARTDSVEVAGYPTLGAAVSATGIESLVPEDADRDGVFGAAVSLSGKRALVGDRFDDALGNAAGSAYVFLFDGDRPEGQQWVQEAKLVADGGGPLDTFGGSVSLDGDRALIGASGNDDAGLNAGAAYVFVLDESKPIGERWTQEAQLFAEDPAPSDFFGSSVSLDSHRAVVGAVLDDVGGVDEGAAFVFGFDGTAWSHEAKLTADDAALDDRFGHSVSLHGDRVLVGAYGVEEEAGAAYVFAYDDAQPPGQEWVQEAKLTADDAHAGDRFGFSTSLNGGRALVGSPRDDAASGSAYVFTFVPSEPPGERWGLPVRLRADDAASGNRFGEAVSIEGDLAIIGSPSDDTFFIASGSAYVFSADAALRTASQWSQTGKLLPPQFFESGRFGLAVSLDGGRVLTGMLSGTDGVTAGFAYVLDVGAALVADAGPDQTVVAGQGVTLDGTGSVGADTFAWTLDGASLSDPNTTTPTFCAAVPGAYDATLVVGNAVGFASDTVTITALPLSAALDALVADVLATSGLSRGQARLLVAELKKAQRALARGADPAPFLDAFRGQVLAFESQGVLTAAAAGALVNSVDAVAGAVATPCTEAAGAPALASAEASAGASGLAVYPNPTAGRATVTFSVETQTDVRLSVVDALGREVAVLADGPVEAGAHRAELDGSSWPAGVYLVRLATADGRVESKQLTRLR